MRIMNGLTSKRSENSVPGLDPFGMRLGYAVCTLQSNRPMGRSFSLCFDGRSVHNAHLLCSCIRGTCPGGFMREPEAAARFDVSACQV